MDWILRNYGPKTQRRADNHEEPLKSDDVDSEYENKNDGCSATFVITADQRAESPSKGRAPLHYAARNGHSSTCRLLVDKWGADPNPKCSKGGVTPLQLAVWQNQLDVVQYLRRRLFGSNGISARKFIITTPFHDVEYFSNPRTCPTFHSGGKRPRCSFRGGGKRRKLERWR
mgnify:CR=1 FL=1